MTCFHIVEPEGEVTELFAKDIQDAIMRYTMHAAWSKDEFESAVFHYNADDTEVLTAEVLFEGEICVLHQIHSQIYSAKWKFRDE